MPVWCPTLLLMPQNPEFLKGIFAWSSLRDFRGSVVPHILSALLIISNMRLVKNWGDSLADATCMHMHALCVHAHFITVRENVD